MSCFLICTSRRFLCGRCALKCDAAFHDLMVGCLSSILAKRALFHSCCTYVPGPAPSLASPALTNPSSLNWTLLTRLPLCAHPKPQSKPRHSHALHPHTHHPLPLTVNTSDHHPPPHNTLTFPRQAYEGGGRREGYMLVCVLWEGLCAWGAGGGSNLFCQQDD